MRPLRVILFGRHLVEYGPALKLQEQLAEARKAGGQDTLLLLQHAPVYTLGKRGSTSDFKIPIEEVKRQGNAVYHAPRGGEVTYHGPGQLVAYPIVGLRDLGLGARAWVEGLEDTVIATLGSYGVCARGRVPGATGVWVGDRKIAALGVKISHAVSSHGLALNVSTDLFAYELIVPCGIRDKQVTSLKQELDRGKPEPGSGGLGDSGGADPNPGRDTQPSIYPTMGNDDSHGSQVPGRCHTSHGSGIRCSGHAHAWTARGPQSFCPGARAVAGMCAGLPGSARSAWPGLAGALGAEDRLGWSGSGTYQTNTQCATGGQGRLDSEGITACEASIRYAESMAMCDCIATFSSMGKCTTLDTCSLTGPTIVHVAGMQAHSAPDTSTTYLNRPKPGLPGPHGLGLGDLLRTHRPGQLTGINTSLLQLSTGAAVPGIPIAAAASSGLAVLPGDPEQAMEQVMGVFLDHFCRQFGFACAGIQRLVPGKDDLLPL